MENSALIFIPDISGFTEFVTKTEIQHSNHIISELIEIIIEANQLSLKVSEIEGDAVLFYRIGEAPKIEEIFNQAKKMFLDFHTHLKIIERDNVCQCGACKTASNLSIKFITHYGSLSEVSVKSFDKIMGSDVILAHRLLKNNIDQTEYLLLSDDYFSLVKEMPEFTDDPWLSFFDHKVEYENFGEIKLKYALLNEAKKFVPDVSDLSYETQGIVASEVNVTFNAPLLSVHSLLIDQSTKFNTVKGIKDVKEDSKINRVNTSHTCVFENFEIHFVTKENSVTKKEIKFIEEGNFSFGYSFINDYKLKADGDKTDVSLRLILPPLRLDGKNIFEKIYVKIKRKFLTVFAKRNLKKGLVVFKNYVESIT